MVDIPQIIRENKKRIDKLFAPYDPIKGVGGFIPREKLILDDLGEFYLPKAFFNSVVGNEFSRLGSLAKFIEEYPGITINDATSIFTRERINHDYEYWTASACKVKPKEGGAYIPFILNAPQRKLHAITYQDIINEEPIRQILCKSRQWGGSTCIQTEMLWIQLIHKTNWNSLIAAHVNQASINIRRMITVIQKNYPKEIGKFQLKAFEEAHNIKYIPERDNKITIGSVEKPDSIRSDDVAMAHLSEVGLWKKTEGKSPEDICQSILGTIPRLPWTMYALESTAKGVGNFFHRSWQNANKPKNDTEYNGLTPIFVSWIEDNNNFEEFKSDNEKIQFIRSMKESEWVLWELGATIEGINFYRNKLREFNNDEWRMKSEFPSTAAEAFQSTGNRVFSQAHILNLRKTCTAPLFTGEITAESNSGKTAFHKIEFIPVINGSLKLWSYPEPIFDIDNKRYKITDRWCGFADFGGQSKNSDYSTFKLIDRYWMVWGGLPEVCAVWHGKLDADLFAMKCAQLSWLHDKALLAFESNTPDQDVNKEGNHFLTAITKLADIYPNLYIRNKHDSINQGWEPKYGFHTNRATKGMIINRLKAAIRDQEYTERHLESCDEMDYFENKIDGSLGAVDGQHDDLVIVTAGSIWEALDYLPPPKLVEVTDQHTGRKGIRRIISEATI